MQAFINSTVSNRNLIKDLLGILVILTFGIGGLIVVSDPIKLLIPEHPMISSQDWPGSRVTQGLEILNTRHWEEERSLLIRLEMEEKSNSHDAEILQKAVWYADPMEPLVAMRKYIVGIVESSLDRDKPISTFHCIDDVLPTLSCYYRAYWGHWYTDVHFLSHSDEYLSYSEIQRIITRVDQLLMSASDPVPLSPPYVIAITATTGPLQPDHLISTPLPFFMPINISLMSCPSFQSLETRAASKGTFIFGDIIIDGVEQYDSNIAGEGTVAYFEKESTVTAPWGADCYIGPKDIFPQVIQNELLHGCGSRCTSIRFVLVQSDGQHVEIYK